MIPPCTTRYRPGIHPETLEVAEKMWRTLPDPSVIDFVYLTPTERRNALDHVPADPRFCSPFSEESFQWRGFFKGRFHPDKPLKDLCSADCYLKVAKIQKYFATFGIFLNFFTNQLIAIK